MDTLVFSDFRYLFLSKAAVVVLNPFLLDTEIKRKEFLDTLQFHPFVSDYESYISVPSPKSKSEKVALLGFLDYVKKEYIKP